MSQATAPAGGDDAAEVKEEHAVVIKEDLRKHIDKYVLVGDATAEPPIFGVNSVVERMSCSFLGQAFGLA